MREQPHYTNLLNKEFFDKYYLEKKMSYPQIRKMLLKRGYNIHVGTLYDYAKKINIGRGASEARRNWDPKSLDYNISYLNDKMIENIDGFLLGDGGINYDKKTKSKVSRFCCGVQYEEFCNYLMDLFKEYNGSVVKRKSKKMKQGFMFSGNTRFHPDIYKQYERWYPKNGDKRWKQPPDDVKITPTSVMAWYLGDGSVVVKENSITLRLSTDGFAKEKVDMLVSKLNDINILCKRSKENRILLRAKGIPAFFDFIGQKSPIKCYNYKFDKVPKWRFKAKRMKDVAKELDVDYQKLSYFVKIGKISCYRASTKGRPRFLPEHIEEIKKLIKSGILN